MAERNTLPIAVLVLVLVMAALVIATYASSSTVAPLAALSGPASTRIPSGRWIAIGTGLTASSTLWNLSPPTRATFGYREGNNRLGGRVLTTPHPVLPVSTWTQALEYLQALEIQSTLQYVKAASCFVSIQGSKLPWPELPTGLDANAPYASVKPEVALALWAHTGIRVTDAPDVALRALLPLAMSAVSAVPTGGGWIGACLRAIGLTPVQYDQRLRSVTVQPDSTLLLQYESGTHEAVQGWLFTGSPDAVLQLQGLPKGFRTRVHDALTPVTTGVLYMTFSAQDIFWPALGFVDATVATDTDLGLITTAETGTLRATMVGAAVVNAWTSMLVTAGIDAAKAHIATLLAGVFGQPSLPKPAFIAFRGWPQGMWLWKAGQDVQATAQVLRRPFGESVAAFWACSELSTTFPNRVEGCVDVAKSTAAAIETAVANQRPLPV